MKKRSTVLVALNSEEEKENIRFNASEAGFKTGSKAGVSPFMRALALGYRPPSIFDRRLLSELNLLQSNLCRVGNLLKRSIFCSPPHDLEEIRKHIEELRSWRSELTEVVDDLNKSLRKHERTGKKKLPPTDLF